VGGELAVMAQFIGSIRDDTTVRQLLVAVSPANISAAAARLEDAENAMIEHDDEQTQIRYAQAIADWGDIGGYEAEVRWDTCTTEALGLPLAEARWRKVASLSGGEQKRLVLHALLSSPPRYCCSTSRTTTSMCRARNGSRNGSGRPGRRCFTSPTTVSSCAALPPGSSRSSRTRGLLGLGARRGF